MIYKLELLNLLQELGASKTKDLTDNIAGNFHVGARYDSDENNLADYFKGQIAGVTVTTLKTGVDLPSDEEIALMTVDPVHWLNTYKVGETYRKPNQNNTTSSFSLNNGDSANATQVYLFGDTNNNSR